VPVADSAPAAVLTRIGQRYAWAVPLAIFGASRLVDALLITLAASDQAARDPEVAYVATPAGEDPGYLPALSNWDGQWYSEIAHHGYPTELPREDGVVQQNAWAFYPLYPGLVRLTMTLFQLSFEVAATTVSVLAGALAMVLLFRLVDRVGGRFNATTTVTAVCLYPAAPVLQAAYSESLALLLIVVCLGLLRDRRFAALIGATALLSLARPIVLPMAGVIAVHALMRWRRRDIEPFLRRERGGYAVATGFAIASFAIWPLVTGLVTGEAGAYLATQRAWIVHGNAGFSSWLGHLTQPGDRRFAVLGIVMLLLMVLLVARRAGRVWGSQLRVWGLAYFVYLLVMTRPTFSFIRFSMLTIVPAWPAPTPLGQPASRRTKVAVMVSIVVIGVPLQYLWLRWFYIPHPGNRGNP
jgi:hypothetical protein